MSKVFFIGDLHFDHKSILTFAGQYRGGSNLKEHNEWIVDRWNSTVEKRDRAYILGDVSFSKIGLEYLKKMRGQKFLVRGNHDQLSTQTYLEYFQQVYGLRKFEGYWLSHAPIHPDELRGRRNIHGHVHFNTIKDPYTLTPDHRYVNVSVENLGGVPISLEQIIDTYGPAVYQETSGEDL